jgi:hypothetical protein
MTLLSLDSNADAERINSVKGRTCFELGTSGPALDVPVKDGPAKLSIFLSFFSKISRSQCYTLEPCAEGYTRC